ELERARGQEALVLDPDLGSHEPGQVRIVAKGGPGKVGGDATPGLEHIGKSGCLEGGRGGGHRRSSCGSTWLWCLTRGVWVGLAVVGGRATNSPCHPSLFPVHGLSDLRDHLLQKV